jgi:hypothetical protein
MMFLFSPLSLDARKQNGKSYAEQYCNKQKQPVVDDITALVSDAEIVRDILLKNHKYHGKRNEKVSDIARNKLGDGKAQKQGAAYDRPDRYLAKGTDKGREYAKRIKHDCYCDKNKSKSPK